jgi:hypothetical protein
VTSERSLFSGEAFLCDDTATSTLGLSSNQSSSSRRLDIINSASDGNAMNLYESNPPQKQIVDKGSNSVTTGALH